MLKLYNTLTRKKEEFQPMDGKTVKMYSCGPTVYSYAHIGNLRTYIFLDILRRVLKYDGYKIKGVMNITDVGHLQSDADEGEDKMVKAAAETGKTPWEIAEFYTNDFFNSFKALNIGKPEVVCKATEHIPDMIEFTRQLVEKGYGYEISDGIYFDISKFPSYGKLSRCNLEEQIAGARVEKNDEKHNPHDFALWKKADPKHIMQWESPWGMGYPGWHIECSAMGKKYLGKTMDIHTGGVDHIPIHHENEIAQSEALNDAPPAKFFMHGEFMLVNNGKMSKSLKNTYTLQQLEERGYSPLDFRYFCLNAHYRKKLNFTFDAMDAAKTAYDKLKAALIQHKNSPASTNPEKIAEYTENFNSAVNNDLNIPLALGILWSAVKEAKSKDIYNFALMTDKIFGLDLDKIKEEDYSSPEEEIPGDIKELIAKRNEARKAKDYAAADRFRLEIEEKGFVLKDTPQGTIAEKKQ